MAHTIAPDGASIDTYVTPFHERYSSPAMLWLFSKRNRINLWRKLWIDLATAQQEVGLEQISDAALKALKRHAEITEEELEIVRNEERNCKYAFMAGKLN